MQRYSVDSQQSERRIRRFRRGVGDGVLWSGAKLLHAVSNSQFTTRRRNSTVELCHAGRCDLAISLDAWSPAPFRRRPAPTASSPRWTVRCGGPVETTDRPSIRSVGRSVTPRRPTPTPPPPPLPHFPGRRLPTDIAPLGGDSETPAAPASDGTLTSTSNTDQTTCVRACGRARAINSHTRTERRRKGRTPLVRFIADLLHYYWLYNNKSATNRTCGV